MDAPIFDGVCFYIQETLPASLVQSAQCSIRESGGTICTAAETAHYILVMRAPRGPRFVTPFWLDDCVLFRRRIPVHCNILYSPCPSLSVEGMDTLTICQSGMLTVLIDGTECPIRRKVKSMVRAVGAMYTNAFTRHNTHLLIPGFDHTSEKTVAAAKWGVPVIHWQWLVECMTAWRKLPEEPFRSPFTNAQSPEQYLFHGPKDSPEDPIPNLPSVPAPKRRRLGTVSEAAPQKIPKPSSRSPLKNRKPPDDVGTPQTMQNDVRTGEKNGRPPCTTTSPRPSTGDVSDDLLSPQFEKSSGGTPNKRTTSARLTSGNTMREAKVFQLGGLTEKVKQMEKILIALGGVCLPHQKNAYDPRCTHMVLPELVRTEKVLCAIAAGNWLLTDEYLLSSQKAGRFVDEGPYSWDFANVVSDKLCLKNIRRWRGATPPFTGWKVAVLGHPPVIEALLAAGGALQLPLTADTIPSLQFVLLPDALYLKGEVRRQLHSVSQPLVRTQFVIDYIALEKTPDMANYFIQR
eukprot:NODE_977_length_1728_cov_31.092442_g916_i0.p1 GENE.NODE_977_length_1728_cov_31.092442_g916_i0~~NODE_977_length_1728_cov_31.092442_g916_i0.p1  ORF type:complete len:556 (-),score=110.12 NODE_977_length_1728_cov_31.092442_g916_i0:61-1614(-)